MVDRAPDDLRVSINTLCLGTDHFDAHVEAVSQVGGHAISPERDAIAAFGPARAARILRDAGVSVVTLTHRAFGYNIATVVAAERRRLIETIDLAHAVGAPSVCMTSGGRGDLSWKEAALRFADEIAPCVEHARAAGVRLGLEPTSHLYADVSIAHRLADAVWLARAANINVGVDLFACWTDSDIDGSIDDAVPLCAFVQVSDYVLGDRGLPCRAVPGDGAVPLQRLIQRLIRAGYRGPFDIEVIGPRLAAEGREAGLRRALGRINEWLSHSIGRPID